MDLESLLRIAASLRPGRALQLFEGRVERGDELAEIRSQLPVSDQTPAHPTGVAQSGHAEPLVIEER